MTDKYILINGKPVPEPDLMKWGTWMQTGDRIVQQDDVDGVKVSTVFLGLDHNFGDGEPVLYETMVFGGKHDGFDERYSTLEEAEKGHKEAVKKFLPKL